LILLTLFTKTLTQKVRDKTSLALALCTTPLFVVFVRATFSFDRYLVLAPGLIVFSITMMVFSTSTLISRELRSSSFVRIRMSGHTMLLPALAISLVQLLEGVVVVSLTISVAELAGYDTNRLSKAFPHVLAAIVAMTGIGTAVGSMARNATTAVLMSSGIMFLFVLFSGIFFPEPTVRIFSIAERTVSLFDLLPTIHLKKIIVWAGTGGTRMHDYMYHSILLVVEASVFYGAGLATFGAASYSNTEDTYNE
jgi:hypothetical protein